MSEMTMKVSTYLDTSSDEICHKLWDTPVVIARPFSKEFVDQLRNDVKDIVAGPGQFNYTDIWRLPDLPETLITVRDKIIELSEKYFRPYAEQPLPPLRISKGYFREVLPGEYRVSPHKHTMNYGVAAFYITAEKRNPGNLCLVDPRGGINWLNQFTPYKRIQVEEGMLVLHPGYLLHYVEPTDYTDMKYDYRLALITGVKRDYDEFLEELRVNDEFLRTFGANGINPNDKNKT
jgi:hypothetical protein